MRTRAEVSEKSRNNGTRIPSVVSQLRPPTKSLLETVAPPSTGATLLNIALRGYRSVDKYGDMLRSTEDSDKDHDGSGESASYRWQDMR